MIRRGWGPATLGLSASLALALAVASCNSRKKDDVFVPVGDLTLDVSFLGGTFEACDGVGSYLLRISEGQDWTYTLQLSGDDRSTLYGCGAPDRACNDEDRLGFTFGNVPTRVMIEGISANPTEHAMGTRYDVICRGVADLVADPASISADESGKAVRARIRVARVGATNPIANPTGSPVAPVVYGAAASFGDAGPSGFVPSTPGEVLLFGGTTMVLGTSRASGQLLAFSPLTHELEVLPPLAPRSGAAAAAWVEDDEPVVGFLGGATDAREQTELGVVVRPDRSTYEVLLHRSRAFASTARVTLQPSGRTFVVVHGGVPYEIASGLIANPVETAATDLAARASHEVVVPIGGTLPGAPYSCGIPASDEATVCRSSEAAVYNRGAYALFPPAPDDPSGDLLLVGGRGEDNSVVQGQHDAPVLAYMESFDPDQIITSGNAYAVGPLLSAPVWGAMPVVLSGSGTSLDGNLLLGGFLDTGGSVASLAVDLVSFGTVDSRSPMAEPRAFAVAVALRDKSVLAAGGAGIGAPGARLQLLVPDAGDSAGGGWEYRRRRPAACDQATGNGCVALRAPRGGTASVRLRGTGTWLDGAVLIYGGSFTADPVELYVPAYRCNAFNQPVIATRGLADPPAIEPGTDTLPPLCDLDKTPEATTDPSNGKTHPAPTTPPD